jgi:aminopeptidase YwaD
MHRLIALSLLALFVWGAAPSSSVQAATPRAIVSGQEPPAGVTVLDQRGDLWLVTGSEDQLASLSGARMLSEFPTPTPPRTFVPMPSTIIDDLVAQVNADDLIAEVEWLIGLGVRFSRSPNLPAVADSLEAKLASFGLTTEQHIFPMGAEGNILVPNVIATKLGSVQPDSVFVLCAHYDATSESAFQNTPGADDNGTGTVTLLTAARLLAPLSLDYTVKFVLFAGEEQGMVGSDYWVKDMVAEGLPILGAMNFDMMGWWTEGVDFDLEIETNKASRWMADAICWAADNYTTMPYELHVDDAAWWGDFFRFWQNGYAAVNHEESWDWDHPDFNPFYHSTNDTPENLSPEFFEGSARIGVAALATLAGVSGLSPVPEVPVAGGDLSASPNPFNGRVVIHLAAGGIEGSQRISVYDLRGRRVDEVKLTVNGGSGQAMWDARGESGQSLPAGVYLAVAESVPGRPSCRVTFLP